MRAQADDAECDSLAGAELGTPGRSFAPRLRPPPRLPKLLWFGWAVAALLVVGALVARVQAEPELTHADSVHVEGRTLSYSEGFAVRAGIRTTAVRQAAFSPVILVAGKAELDPNGVAFVGANALGTVRRVAKYEGERVKRGEVLAEIGSADLARIEAASFLRVRAATGTEAPRALGISVVRSPLEGTVIERRIITGQSVKGERVAFVVANLDRLACDLRLDQNQARVVGVGDRVELVREATGTRLEGRVAQLSAAAPGAGGSGKAWLVHVEVDNRARHLRPGETLLARIDASGGTRALLVPNGAIAWLGGRPAVFIESGHHRVQALPVTIGGTNGEQTEVSFGLSAGQRVVSEGVGALKDESFL